MPRLTNRMLGLVPVLVLTLAACGPGDAGDPTAQGDGVPAVADGLSAGLTGAGATFPDPVYQEWIGGFIAEQSGVSITYEPIGSGGGVEQFIARQTDFGGSDAFMTDEEIAAAEAAQGFEVLHIPTVFGAVALAYNVPGVDAGLVLDADTVAAIYLGDVTAWDDDAIAALNPDVELPDIPIIPAYRSDGSGTTSIFTTYMANESEEWADAIGAGKEVSWPTGVGGQGNDGVAAAIAQNEGGLGYVELSFAIETGLATAAVMNEDGKPVAPSLESTAAAADGIDIPDDLRFSILGVGGDAYPIAGATWVLAYTGGYDPAEADALRAFLTWALEEGDGTAEDLLYAPISDSLQERALANVERINEEG